MLALSLEEQIPVVCAVRGRRREGQGERAGGQRRGPFFPSAAVEERSGCSWDCPLLPPRSRPRLRLIPARKQLRRSVFAWPSILPPVRMRTEGGSWGLPASAPLAHAG